MRSRLVLARAAFLLVATLSLPPADARACSCMTFSYERALEMFDVSFRGRVIRMAVDGEDEVITFAIAELHRGLPRGTRQVSIRRARGIGLCPIPGFTARGTYHVYATRSGDTLRVGACNPSSLVR
jgi:hypothetical protein